MQWGEIMIKTIVVPVDGSAPANRASELAGAIAAKFDARVIVLHTFLHHTPTPDLKAICRKIGGAEEILKKLTVLENAMFDTAAAAYAPVPLPAPPAILRGIGDLITAKARQNVENKGVKQVVTHVMDGKPAENIIAVANHDNADMIVMGRRGLGDIAGLLMGSVSHKVTHMAECACLTVK